MQIRSYGDTANDGLVQLSFTLPLPPGARAREAARRYALLMGISNPHVAHAESVDFQFTLADRVFLMHSRKSWATMLVLALAVPPPLSPVLSHRS